MCEVCGYDPENSKLIQRLVAFSGNRQSPTALGVHVDTDTELLEELTAEDLMFFSVYFQDIADEYARLAVQASYSNIDFGAVVSQGVANFFEKDDKPN